MATPVLTHHSIAGALGPILVDVRTTESRSSQPAVVVHHGFKGFKDYAFIPAFAERLARAGFTAVTISVSGSGVDEEGNFTRLERFARNTYTRELDDLTRVFGALQEGNLGVAPPSSLGLVGHSRGGGMALCLAREMPALGALITWSAISEARRHTDEELELWRKVGTIQVFHQRLNQYLPLSYEVVEDALPQLGGRFNVEGAASQLRCPWLLIHGTDDTTVSIDEGRVLAAAARDPRFESVFIEGAEHAYGVKHPWDGGTPATERLFSASISFLSRYLK